MNIYLVDAGTIRVLQESFDGYGLYDDERVIVLVVAKSPGQVRALMAECYYIEFTDKMSIKKLMSNVDIEEPFIDNWQSHMSYIPRFIPDKYSNQCWSMVCQNGPVTGYDGTDFYLDCPYYLDICASNGGCKYENEATKFADPTPS